MTKPLHIHKLKRLKYKTGNIVFFCALPDCSYKSNVALSLGKRSLCWRCGQSFIINEYSLRLAKPHCEACHKPKKIDATMEEIGIVNEDRGLSLSERLSQTITQAQQQEEEEI
jgi:hypothetical protein